MADYRVRFCNDLYSSIGQPFHACQAEVLVKDSPDRECAVERAKRQFEAQQKVGNWRCSATAIECEELSDAKPGNQASTVSPPGNQPWG